MGVFRKPNAPATAPGNFGVPVNANDLAVSLARSGAFFSNNQAPLSSRTVRFISGIHFPPGIRNKPNAALYGIENTNRGCDLNTVFNPGKTIIPSRALNGLPCNSLDTRGCGAGITTGKANLIDDDPNARDLMRRSLAQHGIRVEFAADGDEGLRRARELKPNVIALDVMMPHKDGWSVLAEIRADSALKQIPVVLVTILDNKQLGLALGASEYVVKPVDFERLAEIVRKLEKPPANPFAATNGHVLIVEDDVDLREMLRKSLEKSGWRVEAARDGKAAIESLKSHAPQVVILDLLMPEMDGFAVVEQMRAAPAWQGIPIVVVTARELTPIERDNLMSRVDEIIQKGGHSLGELGDIIRKTIARHSAVAS